MDGVEFLDEQVEGIDLDQTAARDTSAPVDYGTKRSPPTTGGATTTNPTSLASA